MPSPAIPAWLQRRADALRAVARDGVVIVPFDDIHVAGTASLLAAQGVVRITTDHRARKHTVTFVGEAQ